MTAKQSATGIPLVVRLRFWVRRTLPLLGFAGAVAAILVLLHQRITEGNVIGLAAEVTVSVSSGVAGRLTSVMVAVHQDVEAGDVIATLDDADARIELAAAVLGVEVLRAELEAARQRLRLEDVERTTDLLNLRRRLELDRLGARLGQLEEQARRDRDAATLEGLSAELSRVSRLAGDVIADRRLDNVQADHGALYARIEGRHGLIDEWRDAETAAVDRLQALPELSDELADTLLLPLDAAVRAAEERLELTRMALERRLIRAPSAGRIGAILQRPGEEVVVDEPIVQISATRTTGVRAWLGEQQLALARLGDAVEVRRASAPSIVGLGSIESIGPVVAEVPFHALRDPTLREFGLPVMLRMPSGFELTPGERVSVSLAP